MNEAVEFQYLDKTKYLPFGVLGFISLILLSFYLEFYTYSFVEVFILPYDKFPWNKAIAIRIYLAYLCSLLLLSIFIYRLKYQINKSILLRAVCLYILWAAFPTGTYWDIHLTPSAWPDAVKEPIFLIVPQILTVESGFVFIPGCLRINEICDGGIMDVFTQTINMKFYFFMISNVIFLSSLKYAKPLRNLLCPQQIISKKNFNKVKYTWLVLFALCSAGTLSFNLYFR